MATTENNKIILVENNEINTALENSKKESELPPLIKRCLGLGVQILPFQLSTILRQYEKYTIPEKELNNLTATNLQIYISGLYKSGQEMAYDWVKGFDELKSLGFSEVKRTDGNRTFISLKYQSA